MLRCGPLEKIDSYFCTENCDRWLSVEVIIANLYAHTIKHFHQDIVSDGSTADEAGVKNYLLGRKRFVWWTAGIRYFLDKGLWHIAHFSELCVELISRFPDMPWDWGVISRSPFVTLEFIEQHPSFSWEWRYGVSLNPNITDEFILRHKDDLSPYCLVRNVCWRQRLLDILRVEYHPTLSGELREAVCVFLEHGQFIRPRE